MILSAAPVHHDLQWGYSFTPVNIICFVVSAIRPGHPFDYENIGL
jgi:hypothetical protein